MGLDQYFYLVPADFDISKEEPFPEEDFYFRKHADLHGKIEQLWRDAAPRKLDESFNCIPFELTLPMLEELVSYGMERLKKQLFSSDTYKPEYEGFFWGHSYPHDWTEFFTNALDMIDHIRKGGRVIYYAWW